VQTALHPPQGQLRPGLRAKKTGTAVTGRSVPQPFSMPNRRSVGSSRRIVRSHHPSIDFDPVMALSLKRLGKPNTHPEVARQMADPRNFPEKIMAVSWNAA
jgi:hypothetical protein